MSPQAAISKTVMKSKIPKLVDGSRNDDADSERHRPEQQRQSSVVLLYDFLPQVVWRHLVDDEERAGKDDNSDRGIDDGIYHVGNLDAHLLASCVVVIHGIYGTVRAGIVAHGARNVLDFVDGGEAPAAIFSHAEKSKNKHPVNHVKVSHQSSSPSLSPPVMLSIGAWSLSAQRKCSKFMERQVISAAGTNKASRAIPKKLNCGTSRLVVIS